LGNPLLLKVRDYLELERMKDAFFFPINWFGRILKLPSAGELEPVWLLVLALIDVTILGNFWIAGAVKKQQKKHG